MTRLGHRRRTLGRRSRRDIVGGSRAAGGPDRRGPLARRPSAGHCCLGELCAPTPATRPGCSLRAGTSSPGHDEAVARGPFDPGLTRKDAPMDTYATIGDCVRSCRRREGPSDRVGRRPCRLRCAPYDDRLPHAVGWRRHHELRGSLGGRGGEAGYHRGRLRRFGDRTGHRWGGLRRGRDARRRRCRCRCRCRRRSALCGSGPCRGDGRRRSARRPRRSRGGSGGRSSHGRRGSHGSRRGGRGRRDRRSRGDGRRRRRCLRARCRRTRGEQPERVDVPFLLRRDAHAQVDARYRMLGLTARAHRGDRRALLDRVALRHLDRAQMNERHRVPIGREDREAPPVRRERAGEAHRAGCRGTDRRSRRARDVDAAVLPGRVRVTGQGERPEDVTVGGP